MSARRKWAHQQPIGPAWIPGRLGRRPSRGVRNTVASGLRIGSVVLGEARYGRGVTLLGVLEDDEYLPEYGTLVIRDRYSADGLEPLENELLGELATEALSGTVATAGDGWVHGHARDPFQ